MDTTRFSTPITLLDGLDCRIDVQGTLLLAYDGRLSWQGQRLAVEHRWQV